MQPAQPSALPTITPTPSFGEGAAAEEPMRNFGFTVAAYSVLWAILLAFVVMSWRKQAALEARLRDLERAADKWASGGGKGA